MIKRFILLLAMPLALAACQTPGGISNPGTVACAQLTDERAAGVELAYKGLRTSLEIATDAGLIRGERALTVAAADRRAYALVLATRAAYRACNAESYLSTATEARAVIEQALVAIRGN